MWFNIIGFVICLFGFVRVGMYTHGCRSYMQNRTLFERPRILTLTNYFCKLLCCSIIVLHLSWFAWSLALMLSCSLLVLHVCGFSAVAVRRCIVLSNVQGAMPCFPQEVHCLAVGLCPINSGVLFLVKFHGSFDLETNPWMPGPEFGHLKGRESQGAHMPMREDLYQERKEGWPGQGPLNFLAVVFIWVISPTPSRTNLHRSL